MSENSIWIAVAKRYLHALDIEYVDFKGTNYFWMAYAFLSTGVY